MDNVTNFTGFFWSRSLNNDVYKTNKTAEKFNTLTGIDVAHPGIDKTIDPEERRYVRYYQWVCFCLFFQVISF